MTYPWDESYIEATGFSQTDFLRDVEHAIAPTESETKPCERCGVPLESRTLFGPGTRPFWVEVTDTMDRMLVAHTLDRCEPVEVAP